MKIFKNTSSSFHLKSGFTLIELLIVITIIGIMLSATYAPYAHYQKKALLKQGVKEITQSIYEARNLAINGLNFGTGDPLDYENVSIGLYMDASENKKTKLTYYSYPHDLDFSSFTSLSPSTLPGDRIIKIKDLPNGIHLGEMQQKEGFLFLYDAISGDGYYYSGPQLGTLEEITDPKVSIDISYKGADPGPLQRTIQYYTETYIGDYE